jgi:hypothetical protein
MKRVAQSSFSTDGQQAFEQHAHALHQMEDLSSVTIRNYLVSLQCFIASCEYSARRTGPIAVLRRQQLLYVSSSTTDPLHLSKQNFCEEGKMR